MRNQLGDLIGLAKSWLTRAVMICRALRSFRSIASHPARVRVAVEPPAQKVQIEASYVTSHVTKQLAALAEAS